MNQRQALLLLGFLIALLCIPATVIAAEFDSGDDPYIQTELVKPNNYTYLNLIIEAVDVQDPLNSGTPAVELQGTGLKTIKLPNIGEITRDFTQPSGTYRNGDVEVTVTIASPSNPVERLPETFKESRVYTSRAFPDFKITAVQGEVGNVLLLKCPESVNEDVSFTELFKSTMKEGYLFNTTGILYVNDTTKGLNGEIHGSMPYNKSDLAETLSKNQIILNNFKPYYPKSAVDCMPQSGEYLIAVVKYDSGEDTMHVLAAMPVLILDEDTKATWNGKAPNTYYKQSDGKVTISFGNNEIDRIGYALVQSSPDYSLDVTVNTTGLAKQPLPTSLINALDILKGISGKDAIADYNLTCGEDTRNVKYDRGSSLAIVEGYGCSGYAEAPSIEIAAETLKKLNAGDYYLYALGMDGQKVVAVDQNTVKISDAARPTPTPTPRGGGGGGGGGGPSGPTEPSGPVAYEGTGSLMTDSTGIVVQSIAVSAVDGVATVIVPAGVQALDANGNPLTEVGIEPLASDAVPAVPAGAVFAFAGYAYVASPAGATFDPAITLTLEIPEDVWNTLDLESEQLSVKWYNEETGLWEDVPTTFDPETRTVRATVTHFSIFALFTEPIEATVTPIETPTTTTTTTAPGGETPTEGLPVTMILGIFVVVIIIAAAGYFLLKRK